MPIVKANEIELWYDEVGDPDDEPLLLISGFGVQAPTLWSSEFCLGLADRGFRVIRFDNRDTGLSTHFEDADMPPSWDLDRILHGDRVPIPYELDDLADDAVGLLDHLDIPAAHVVGLSMGGAIAQILAVDHRERVLTLTSIMSTTSDRDVGQPAPEAAAAVLARPPSDRFGAVQALLDAARAVASREHWDEDRMTRLLTEAYDRAFDPGGAARQLLAVFSAPSRTKALHFVDVPALVIHGDADPLVDLSGGRRTAEAIARARLVVVEGMGHDLPPPLWPQVIDEIAAHASGQ